MFGVLHFFKNVLWLKINAILIQGRFHDNEILSRSLSRKTFCRPTFYIYWMTKRNKNISKCNEFHQPKEGREAGKITGTETIDHLQVQANKFVFLSKNSNKSSRVIDPKKPVPYMFPP